MSISANQLGGKCPYMPYLGRGQMSRGEHVLHSFVPHNELTDATNDRNAVLCSSAQI